MTPSHDSRGMVASKRIRVMARVVHEHVQALLLSKDRIDGAFPILWRGHVEFDRVSAAGRILGERIGGSAIRANAQPNHIFGILRQKCARDGLAQAAVGAGHENDTRNHSGHRDKPDAGISIGFAFMQCA